VSNFLRLADLAAKNPLVFLGKKARQGQQRLIQQQRRRVLVVVSIIQ